MMENYIDNIRRRGEQPDELDERVALYDRNAIDAALEEESAGRPQDDVPQEVIDRYIRRDYLRMFGHAEHQRWRLQEAERKIGKMRRELEKKDGVLHDRGIKVEALRKEVAAMKRQAEEVGLLRQQVRELRQQVGLLRQDGAHKQMERLAKVEQQLRLALGSAQQALQWTDEKQQSANPATLLQTERRLRSVGNAVVNNCAAALRRLADYRATLERLRPSEKFALRQQEDGAAAENAPEVSASDGAESVILQS